MELALKDKVILVTGGAAGIGQEIVKKLHALEAIPIVVDRVKKLKRNGGKTVVLFLNSNGSQRTWWQKISAAKL